MAVQVDKKVVFMGVGILVGVIGIAIASRWLYKKLDIQTKLKLRQLRPEVRKKVEKFLIKAQKAGIPLKVTSAYRDCEEQNKLYAQGRTAPGGIVTNAKCGQSDHNVGVAVDIVPIVDGRANYKVPESVWNTIGAIGESVDLSWGGRWTSFKDRPHFYDRGGKSIAQLWTEQQNLANLA